MSRDPIENADQPPEVDIHDDSKRLPPSDAAARRVIAFVSWFGDGEVWARGDNEDTPPLYSRDLSVIAQAELTPTRAVLDFINQRTEYVQAARNTVTTDGDGDYWRWQGHMEARRQLASLLGYTVPYEPGEKTSPTVAG